MPPRANIATAGSVLSGGGAPPSVIEGARFYALNLLSELDAPGEYFLDRKAGRLYVYPPAGLDDAVDASSLPEHTRDPLESVFLVIVPRAVGV